MKRLTTSLFIQFLLISAALGQNTFQKMYSIYNVGIWAENTQNTIETTDGGYAFVTLADDYYGTGSRFGLFVKVNNQGNVEWSKRIESVGGDLVFNSIVQAKGFIIEKYISFLSVQSRL